MQGIEILVVTLAAFFGLGIFFAILLWCRGWQREQSDRQFQSLRALSDRLGDALDMLDHTAASLQTVDGQLTQQLEDLRSSVLRLQNVRPGASLESGDAPLQTARSAEPTTNGDSSSQSEPRESTSATSDRYDEVQALLKKGRSTVEIAHDLDIGVAEVRMIARMKAIQSPERKS